LRRERFGAGDGEVRGRGCCRRVFAGMKGRLIGGWDDGQLRVGGQKPLDIDEVDPPAPAPEDELIAMHEAFDKFEIEDRQKAELVKLRYFGGLTFEEAAQVLGVSILTTKRWWAYSRAWLFSEMSHERSSEGEVNAERRRTID
jgi:DNA-directed RNA polymerase specialized sigma24 family protein